MKENGAPVGSAPRLDCETADSSGVRDAATARQRSTQIDTARRPGRKTARTAAPRVATLKEPIKVAEFWKNRRGESVRITLTAFEERDLIDVRVYYTAKDGVMQPTKKGLTLVIEKLPELADALNKAREKAIDLHLIELEPGQ